MARPTDWNILDLDHDPAPGEPWRVRELAGRLRDLGDEAEQAARDVRGLAGDNAAMNWIGASGDQFRQHIGKFPGQLDKVATSHHLCADALLTFGNALDGAQSQADRALTQARPLYQQVQTLRSQLASANTDLTTAAKGVTSAQAAATVDQNAVHSAQQTQTTAQNAVDSLNSQLSGPEAQLAALKKLAHEAESLRQGAEETARTKINAATDAGIPPDSFWHKLGDLCAALWHGLVIIAKIVSFIGAIVLMIVGGPLWLIVAVVVAGLIILADTLYKYANGQASLWDVGLAVLSCIPVTKGLTSIANLKQAFALGRFAGDGSILMGALGVGGHLLATGGGAFKALLLAPKALWDARAALPSLLKALPFTALGKATSMAQQVRCAVPMSLWGVGVGFRDGTGVFGTVRSTFSGLVDGWRDGANMAKLGPAQSARGWQASSWYPGIDVWHNDVAPAGNFFEALHPGLSGYAVPGGSMGALGDDASRISQGVQVSPSDIGGGILHNYRPEGIIFQTNQNIDVATAHALANPQYGAGGQVQHFFPNFTSDVAAGRIHFVAPDGTTLPTTINNGRVFVTTSAGQTIPLTNLDVTAGSGVHLGSTVNNVVVNVGHIWTGLRVGGYSAGVGNSVFGQ